MGILVFFQCLKKRMNPAPQKKCVIDVLSPRNFVKCRETQNAHNVSIYAGFGTL